MRVVVRVLTNEINHASPSDDPFLLEYIWSDGSQCQTSGWTNHRFPFYKSPRNRGQYLEWVWRIGLVFSFFFFFLDGQVLELDLWKYVTILEEGMKLYAIALQVIM